MIPLTVAEIKRLFNATTARTASLEHTAHWSAWRRRHQARARWFHRRARGIYPAQLTNGACRTRALRRATW